MTDELEFIITSSAKEDGGLRSEPAGRSGGAKLRNEMEQFEDSERACSPPKGDRGGVRSGESKFGSEANKFDRRERSPKEEALSPVSIAPRQETEEFNIQEKLISRIDELEKKVFLLEASSLDSYQKMLDTVNKDFKKYYFAWWAEELRNQRPFIGEDQLSELMEHLKSMVEQLFTEKFGIKREEKRTESELHIVLFNTLHTSLMAHLETRLNKCTSV